MTGRAQEERNDDEHGTVSGGSSPLGRVQSSLRWLIRGERNVTGTLDGLTASIVRLEQQAERHEQRLAAQQAELTGVRADLDAKLGELSELRRADAWAVAEPPASGGVNVIGYLQRQLGIGDVARRLVSILRHHDVPTSAIAFGASTSPTFPSDFAISQRLAYDTTIAVVAADQLDMLRRTHPEAFAASQRMIGYCFWELETITQQMQVGLELIDEVWTGSRFIHDAFASLGSIRVHHVPIPVAEPQTSGRDRSTFPALADVGDEPVFGVVFDHFSVMERKNPLGAIQAFVRAFAPGEGPRLVIKTLNGDLCSEQHEALLAAIGDRDDIVVWDEHLAHDDHMALISSFDALVSLHRSEGLGLHLAEAMWLGVPVVATRYSGNLDFMDDECALLVDHEMIPVRDGRGIYPSGAVWADPDIEVAAAALRRLADSESTRRQVGAAGRERMIAQSDVGAAVDQITRLVAATLPE